MFRKAFVSALIACAFASATSANAADPAIKIGFLGSFTGSLGAVAQDQYDGFMLALEQRGGKLGGVPIEVVKEDDQLKPEVGVSLTQKLIERDNVPIIVGMTGSNIMMAVSKPVTDKQVFLISTNAAPSPLAGKGCSPYQFVTSVQLDMIAEVVGKYATEKGYKKLLLLAPNYQAGKDMLVGFKRYYKGNVVDEILTPLNQLDFSTEIAQIATSKPDAVFVFYPGALGVTFVRQYQQAGLMKKVPLLSSATLDGTTLPGIRDAAIGAMSGYTWAPDIGNSSNQQFVKAFESRYKRIPSNQAAHSYDGALLLDSAIAKVRGDLTDKNAFAAALKGANFKSVRGNFKFGNNNFPIQDMRILEVVKDDQSRVTLKAVATPLENLQDSYHDQCPLK